NMEIVHVSPNEYRKWLRRVGPQDIAAIARRLDLLSEYGLEVGLPNVRRINELISELRIPSGLRLYFAVDDDLAVFVKYGNKDTQSQDIATATSRAKDLHNDH
ncbi:MAG: type II toxin-antitoxin system RelE/ParE family toxin, partial [Thermoleophilia bacterium]|nr:type II toxin-antitoxin system RelE/ParE family toxin [Thermoleophilia bacterium]